MSIFEGEDVTAMELHRRAPIYSRRWLSEALRAGCQTWDDLARRWAERSRRQLRALKAKKPNHPWLRKRAY